MYAKQHIYKYSHEVGFGGVGCEDEILIRLRLEIILGKDCRGPKACRTETVQKSGFGGYPKNVKKVTKNRVLMYFLVKKRVLETPFFGPSFKSGTGFKVLRVKIVPVDFITSSTPPTGSGVY